MEFCVQAALARLGIHEPAAASDTERGTPKTSPGGTGPLGQLRESLASPIVGIGHNDLVTEEKEAEMMRLGLMDNSEEVPS